MTHCQFGKVRGGWDMATKESVVIKECLQDCVQDRKDVRGYRTDENIWQEIKILRRISKDPSSCQYIIKLLDVVKDKKHVYLILEHATNGDLRSYINSRNGDIKAELRRQWR